MSWPCSNMTQLECASHSFSICDVSTTQLSTDSRRRPLATSTIGGFRVSSLGRLTPLPLPYPVPLPLSLNPSFPHPSLFPFPFPSMPYPLSPLDVDPWTQLGGLGSAVSSPTGSGRSPAAERYFVDFGLQKSFWWELYIVYIYEKCNHKFGKLTS